MVTISQSVLADNTYSKPYFMTYYNTALFIVPLVPILAMKAYRHPEELRQWRNDCASWTNRLSAPVKRNNRHGGLSRRSSRGSRRRESASDSRELLLGSPAQSSQYLSAKSDKSVGRNAGQLSLSQTTKLSFQFCLLWFLANYFIGASLQFTTVASSTILTSTSSIFTLIFGVMARVETFTLRKLIGILASLAGIIMISSIDLSGNTTDDDHRGDFPEKSFGELAVGDILAFLAAIIYGMYSVLMKKRIADESAVNMPLFFGIVGVINVMFLWPGFFLLHWTGIERFELPDTGRTTLIITLNAMASLVADLASAYAVLLTSPIVVTVGLSMTIPLSLIGQMLLNSQTANVLYWIGAVVVVLSFVFINYEEKKDEQP